MDSISSNSKTKDKDVDDKVKSILRTVLERCKRECDSSALQVPLDEYEQRASYYTAFPVTYVNALIDKGNIPTKTQCFNIKQMLYILECLSQFYENKISPTYKLIYDTVENRTEMPEFTVYKQEMCTMGYYYRKLKSGILLVENPKYTFKRYHYLNKIRKLRSNDENICYIDARIINKEMNFERYTDMMDESLPYNQYVFLHAVSKNGYINGLFTNTITDVSFIKWMNDILLPNLNTGTTIVVDKCIFDIFLKSKTITRYNTKKEMIEWLKSNHIPCHKTMAKADLYELISNSKVRFKCKIYHILHAYGHGILCLPFKFDKLTPIDLMWEYIKKEINSPTDEQQLVKIKQQIESYINSIDETIFSNFNLVIEEQESKILQLDSKIEEILDSNYKFNTEDILQNEFLNFVTVLKMK
ncbi:uncharacterized protein ACR2FA_011982 [Aphomia sociella]